MNSYDKRQWAALYNATVEELEHASAIGVIGKARKAMTTHIETLRQMPDLNLAGHRTLEDALKGLRLLAQEEARYKADERRIAGRAVENLLIVGPVFALANAHHCPPRGKTITRSWAM